MSTPKRMKLRGVSAEQMEQGILLVFKRWRELRDAVDGLFGGPHSHHKASLFTDHVINFFCKPNGRPESPSIDKLLDLLDDGMDDLGLVEVESVNEVANILMNMHEECLENNYQRIQEFKDTAQFFDNKTAPNPFSKEVASISDDNAGDNEGSSMIANSSSSSPNQEGASQGMELDEAPWTTVASKKSKCRKN